MTKTYKFTILLVSRPHFDSFSDYLDLDVPLDIYTVKLNVFLVPIIENPQKKKKKKNVMP